MSWPSSPAWLCELQARFGHLLRTPLDRSTGNLRADTAAYDAVLVEASLPNETSSGADRLAIYHRQYWFRLFTTLQGLYPLSARLVGYWRFNDFAAQHLLRRPPRGFDIEAIGDDFELSLAEQLQEAGAAIATDSRYPIEASALLDAARVDAAFHRVSRAPRSEPFRPEPADAARFADSCLLLSPSAALLQERWPVSELRVGLADRPSNEPIQLAEPWPTPRHWLLSRQDSKLGLLELSPREAELLRLVQQMPLEQALGRLEAAAAPAERALLPERTRAWLSRSVRLGIWAGFGEIPK